MNPVSLFHNVHTRCNANYATIEAFGEVNPMRRQPRPASIFKSPCSRNHRPKALSETIPTRYSKQKKQISNRNNGLVLGKQRQLSRLNRHQ